MLDVMNMSDISAYFSKVRQGTPGQSHKLDVGRTKSSLQLVTVTTIKASRARHRHKLVGLEHTLGIINMQANYLTGINVVKTRLQMQCVCRATVFYT